jgi:hypothetical protein
MYLQTIEIHRMFLNVATVSVTNRSISFIKKKIDFFKHFFTFEKSHRIFLINVRLSKKIYITFSESAPVMKISIDTLQFL